MNIVADENKVVLEGIKDFDLDHIFDSGQCFRWEKEKDGSFTGIAYGKILNLSKDNDSLSLNGISLEDYNKIWKSYFDIERDYGQIKKFLSENDSIMERAISYGSGMRILKQEKWETLISFIISQNNNIPRIKKCVESLCQNYGKLAGVYNGREYYSFPKPEDLAALRPEELDICRFGYRAKYIYETAQKVVAEGIESLEEISAKPTCQAYEDLLCYSGVGPKVANCILLFSMGKYESFPLDVWIKRVMNKLYSIEEGNAKAMQNYAAQHFGMYGGIAQQYLFYYMRETGGFA